MHYKSRFLPQERLTAEGLAADERVTLRRRRDAPKLCQNVHRRFWDLYAAKF